jgi:uncharacterized protein (TIGR04141 family)
MDKDNASTISIYKIDLKLLEGIVEFDEIPKTIIDLYNSKTTNQNELFKPQNIKRSVLDSSYNHSLYYGNKRRQPKWAGFINVIAAEDQEINNPINSYASFVYFLANPKTKNIFVITGGQGNFLIQGYIDDYFGIEILSRLIKKDDKSIRTLQERGLTGSLLSASKIFRNNASFLQEDNFGKLFKQVQAGLDPARLRQLGIESKRGATCLAKSSFRINKSLAPSAYFNIITAIELLLTQDSLFTINRVTELSKKKDSVLIENLDQQLLNNFFESVKSGSLQNFDFAHTDIESFYTASVYQFSRGKDVSQFHDPEIDNVREFIMGIGLQHFDIKGFAEEVSKIHVQSFDHDGNTMTKKGKLLEHLHTEISYKNESYIRIDTKWLKLSDEFTQQLNEDLKLMISRHYDGTVLDEKFNSLEDDYNASFIGKPNTYVVHKTKEENIEICDIIITSENDSNLIHVKQGFDSSMRDLCAQIRIAANYLYTKKTTRSVIIENINKQLGNLKTSSDRYSKSISEQVIPIDVLDKRIIFTLAVADTAKGSRQLVDDLSKFDSNIAKFELLNLYRDLSALGFDFKLIQI